MVSDVGRMTYGSSSSLPPAMVTTASSGEEPSTCWASLRRKHAGEQLPADHVGPLIEQHGQVAPAVNPLGEEVPHNGLRRRPDDVRLFQFLAACDGDYGQFRGKAFHVLGFLAQETLRDEQREIHVLVIGSLEALVEFALQDFPHRVPGRSYRRP